LAAVMIILPVNEVGEWFY